MDRQNQAMMEARTQVVCQTGLATEGACRMKDQPSLKSTFKPTEIAPNLHKRLGKDIAAPSQCARRILPHFRTVSDAKRAIFQG